MAMRELAYMSAAEMAERVQAAKPVAGRDRRRLHRPHRGAQSKPQRLRLRGLRRRARAAPERPSGGHVGRGDSGRCMACPRHQGSVRLQAGLAVHLRRRARDEGLRRAMALRVRRAGREGRRHPARQDQQPDDGPARHLRQLSVRPDAQSLRSRREHRRLVGRQRRGGR